MTADRELASCAGCGQALSDGGPVGLYCGNKDCNYERDVALRNMAAQQERNERKELARLKAKYEVAEPVEGDKPVAGDDFCLGLLTMAAAVENKHGLPNAAYYLRKAAERIAQLERPTPAAPADAEREALIARIQYIMDTTRSLEDRMRSRSHLTNHDLRMCIAALKGFRHD